MATSPGVHGDWVRPGRGGSVAPGARVLTRDGMDIGHVTQVMSRPGTPPCLVLRLDHAGRPDGADVVVTCADVTVAAGRVCLRHVDRADLGTTGWARAGALADERPPSRLEGERHPMAPVRCAGQGRTS